MKHRPLLGLLLVALQTLPRPAAVFGETVRFPSPERQSHRRLGDAPQGFGDAEDAVSQRIKDAHRRHEMQDLAQKLHDPMFLRELSEGANLTPKEVNALREKINQKRKVDADPTWQRLLKRAADEGRLSKDQVDILMEWARERPDVFMDPAGSSRSRPSTTEGSGPGEDPNRESGSSPTADHHAQPPRPEHFWDWSGQQVKDATTGLLNSVGDALDADDSPDGRSLRNTIRQFRGGGFKNSGLRFDLTNYAPGLSGYFPDLRQFVSVERLSPRGFTSLFRNASLPNVSRLGRRSVPSVSRGSASRLGEGFLWMATLLVLAAVLWKAFARVRREGTDRAARPWRLGPWPVAPAAVSTRAELIAAFEHLAFLRLGQPARACNHLEVANKLADAAGGDAMGRQAAGQLAHLYEQARYAPADEALSEEDLAAARRDLCFLAGVARA